MMDFFRKRFRNYGFWCSALALIPISYQMISGNVFPEEYAPLCNALLTFLVAAGLISSPTTKNKWFLDD